MNIKRIGLIGGSGVGGGNGFTKIVNDLTTGGIDKALSAEQGKILNSTKQNTLNGTEFKTVNGSSIWGSGNIVITGEGSSVEIVNDLITGGADKALSAEMGKMLGVDVSKLNSSIFGRDFEFTLNFTSGYQSIQTPKTIFKGERITLPDGVIVTGRTNKGDSDYQTLAKSMVADRDINWIKNNEITGDIVIKVEKSKKAVFSEIASSESFNPATKGGIESYNVYYNSYYIDLEGLYELGVRYVRFRASSNVTADEKTNGNIIPAIIYTNDGIKTEVLTDSEYNLTFKKTGNVNNNMVYWYKVPITSDSTRLRATYGNAAKSDGTDSHVFNPANVFFELEDVKTEHLEKEVSELSNSVGEYLCEIKETSIIFSYEYENKKLPFTIPKGTAIELSRDVKVTCRTNKDDTTYQTVVSGNIADRDINFVKSGAFTGELTLTVIKKDGISNIGNEVEEFVTKVADLQTQVESLKDLESETIRAKEGSGISYREMSKLGLRPIKILGVGNSWTGNAMLNIGSILKDMGIPVQISYCYTGSATLELYNNNINDPVPRFEHRRWNSETNAWDSSELLPYEDIFMSDDWDIITHQQQSGRAGVYDTFQPYLNNIIRWEKKVSRIIPLIAIHATWAYPNGYDNAQFEEYYGSDTTTMYNSVISAYNQAMQDEGINMVFPSAPIIQQIRALGIENVDTPDGGSHLSTSGCFAASCVWAETLLRRYYYESISKNKSVADSSFKPAGLKDTQADQIKSLAVEIVNNISEYFPLIS